jgi:hypothetical protein
MSEPLEIQAPIGAPAPVNQDGVEWRLEIEASPSLISRFAAFGVLGLNYKWTLCFDSNPEEDWI